MTLLSEAPRYWTFMPSEEIMWSLRLGHLLRKTIVQKESHPSECVALRTEKTGYRWTLEMNQYCLRPLIQARWSLITQQFSLSSLQGALMKLWCFGYLLLLSSFYPPWCFNSQILLLMSYVSHITSQFLGNAELFKGSTGQNLGVSWVPACTAIPSSPCRP